MAASVEWANCSASGSFLARQDDFLKAYNELLMWEEHTIEWYDIRADIYVDESQGGRKQRWAEKTGHARYAHEAAQQIEKECAGDFCRIDIGVHSIRTPALNCDCLTLQNDFA